MRKSAAKLASHSNAMPLDIWNSRACAEAREHGSKQDGENPPLHESTYLQHDRTDRNALPFTP